MPDKFGDKIRLEHALDAVAELETFMLGVDLDTFLSSTVLRLACVRSLEIIGEAVSHVSKQLRAEHLDIDWKDIIGLRIIIAHEYFGLSYELIFGIFQDDIPEFKSKVEKIVRSLA